jgi:hypothetical protein
MSHGKEYETRRRWTLPEVSQENQPSIGRLDWPEKVRQEEVSEDGKQGPEASE